MIKSLKKAVRENKYVLSRLCLLLVISINLSGQENNSFLLKPTGKYSVGVKEMFAVDSTRKEKLKLFHNTLRKLYIKVWYPADKPPANTKYNKYLSTYNAKDVYKVFKVKKVSIADIDSLKKYDTYSFNDIDISKAEKEYPVILFNPGFYFGMSDLYTCFMEELASNGFIVFSIVHPYHQPLVTYPDGDVAKLKKKKAQLAFMEWAIKENIKIEKVNTIEEVERLTRENLRQLKRFNKIVKLWVVDNSFFIDYLQIANQDTSAFFYSKLDMNRLGVFGQSIGGAAAGQLCFTDDRLKAGINLDCFQFGDIVDNDMQTPFMLIESEFQKPWNVGNDYIFSKTTNDFYSILFLNTTHLLACDAPILPVLSEEQKMSFYGDVDGGKSLKLINKYILDFFNFYLKNISSDFLEKEYTDTNVIYKVRSN